MQSKYKLLDYLNVSRETCLDFEEYISMIVKKNKEINLISKLTAQADNIRERHIIDSAQVIDFVDLNNNTTCDLGSGGGFPGIVVAIMIKNMKKNMTINLHEKSHHKSKFLKETTKKLNLGTKVFSEDIFKIKELSAGTIIARAFKPLPVVLKLVYENFKRYTNLIIFMGKSGEKILGEALNKWEFDYEKKKSITSKDSFLLNIKNIKKNF